MKRTHRRAGSVWRRTRRARERTHAVLLCALLLPACGAHSATGPTAGRSSAHFVPDLSRCARLGLGPNSFYRIPLPEPLNDEESRSVLSPVPDEVRRTLAAAGLEEPLARVLRARSADSGASLELLALQQELDLRLRALDAQLSSSLFEADCTGDELEAFLQQRDRGERRRELALTIASLVVAGTAAIGAGTMALAADNEHAEQAFVIGGGVVSSTLGVTALVERRGSVRVEHARNLLAPIVEGRDPDHLYPTFVFRLLTWEGPQGSPSPAAELRERFQSILAAHDAADAEHEAILYGKGGVYDRSLLVARQEMLDELESTLQGFRRDLELLERYLVQLYAANREGSASGETPH